MHIEKMQRKKPSRDVSKGSEEASLSEHKCPSAECALLISFLRGLVSMRERPGSRRRWSISSRPSGFLSPVWGRPCLLSPSSPDRRWSLPHASHPDHRRRPRSPANRSTPGSPGHGEPERKESLQPFIIITAHSFMQWTGMFLCSVWWPFDVMLKSKTSWKLLNVAVWIYMSSVVTTKIKKKNSSAKSER